MGEESDCPPLDSFAVKALGWTTVPLKRTRTKQLHFATPLLPLLLDEALAVLVVCCIYAKQLGGW